MTAKQKTQILITSSAINEMEKRKGKIMYDQFIKLHGILDK